MRAGCWWTAGLGGPYSSALVRTSNLTAVLAVAASTLLVAGCGSAQPKTAAASQAPTAAATDTPAVPTPSASASAGPHKPGTAMTACPQAENSAGKQAAAPQTPAPGTWGKNLLTNGDAESTPPGADPTQGAKPVGWIVFGDFVSMPYGADGGYPDLNTPGPSDRGKRFFSGGKAECSTATQLVQLPAASAGAAATTFRLSGHVGGFDTQDDQMIVTATFYDDSGKTVGTARIGPVLSVDRAGEMKLLYREATGKVPAGARSAEVTVVSIRTSGEANDGYGDNLSFQLGG